jgi:hypothetical protein
LKGSICHLEPVHILQADSRLPGGSLNAAPRLSLADIFIEVVHSFPFNMADTKMQNIHVEESAGLKIDKFICRTHVFWALFPLGFDAKMTARQTN